MPQNIFVVLQQFRERLKARTKICSLNCILHIQSASRLKSNNPVQRNKRLHVECTYSLPPQYRRGRYLSSVRRKQAEGSRALVAFVNAGYPRKYETVPILSAVQGGGADRRSRRPILGSQHTVLPFRLLLKMESTVQRSSGKSNRFEARVLLYRCF
ncbi:hypothetical protein EDD15DRAFT_90039 [Pisolithus albus]|nr:hypothetical protein EDD15DRAFT_90039 [Pisolithus albus]